jgi:KDO2-lipid IV(A) lauroyltransferase
MAHRLRDAVLYGGLRTFLGVGSRLPRKFTGAIGGLLGRVAFRFSTTNRARIQTHLQIAFPELQPEKREAIIRDNASHFGLMLAEVAWLWRASPKDVESICRFDGAEHLLAALDGGRGAMMVTAHCGNWELLCARIPVGGIPLTSAVRQLDNPKLDHLITTVRTRFGTEILPRGPSAGRKLARALAKNRVVGLLIDQDIRDVPGVFVPFFGRPAWTPSGAATLALRLGCPVIPTFIHRLPDGSHRTEVHPPLPIPVGGSLEDRVQQLTAASTAAIERQIRAHPDQWVWMHRRWRTQTPPAGG